MTDNKTQKGDNLMSDVMDDRCWHHCNNCEEVYHLPEGIPNCPICGKKSLEAI